MSPSSLAAWLAEPGSAPGLITFEWALLLALAASAGHLVQRLSGLPKLLGYAGVGVAAGLLGLVDAHWPLRGLGLFLLELGIAVVLFEAGARLSLRWLRHNPMVLVQSLAEAALTFSVAFLALRALGLDVKVVRALAILAVAASPAVLMRVASDLRASGPVTDRAITLATLNTLYALTLGAALLDSIDRGAHSLLDSLVSSAHVLGLSALVGAVLAALALAALRLLRPTSIDTPIVLLALVAACVAATQPLDNSPPLATLLGGLMLRQLHRRSWMWPQQLGTAASMLNIIMFVLVSAMAVQGRWSLAIIGATAALIGARAAAKILALGLSGPLSGMSLRQGLWTGFTLLPMSSVALLLTSQFVNASQNVGLRVAAIALPMILVTELLGAVLLSLALVRAGEAAPPWRGRRLLGRGEDGA